MILDFTFYGKVVRVWNDCFPNCAASALDLPGVGGMKSKLCMIWSSGIYIRRCMDV